MTLSPLDFGFFLVEAYSNFKSVNLIGFFLLLGSSKTSAGKSARSFSFFSVLSTDFLVFFLLEIAALIAA